MMDIEIPQKAQQELSSSVAGIEALGAAQQESKERFRAQAADIATTFISIDESAGQRWLAYRLPE
jgi:hypothetical protein